MKSKKPFRYNIVYFIVIILVSFFRVIPRRVGINISRFLVIIYYRCARKTRKNTIQNLTIAFGNEKSSKQIKKLARNVFIHFATVAVDTIRTPIYIKKGIEQYVTTKNLHHLEAALDSKKGFLLLTGHFGNWELMGAWGGQQGHKLHVVSTALSNPKLNKLIVDNRKRAGCINIERGNATKKIIKALKEGHPVAMLIDQDTRTKGVFVDFFGKKAHTPIGLAALAGMMNVPIITMAMHIKKDLSYEIESFPPLYYEDTGNKVADITALTQKCTDLFEKIIRRHPEQWAWMHRRWKKQLGGKIEKKYIF